MEKTHMEIEETVWPKIEENVFIILTNFTDMSTKQNNYYTKS